MLKPIINLILSAVAIFVVSKILPGFQVDSLITALVVAIVFGVVNILIKPIILFLTLPINFLTLGLFTFVVNAFLLWVVSLVIEGFKIENFFVAIVAVVLLWIINLAFQLVKSQAE